MNQHKFDKIDTEDKAYWLGFLWGDGCCQYRQRKNSEEWSLKLDLKETDHNHVVKFKNFVESTHPIKFYPTKGFGGKTTNICRFRFNCVYLGKLLWQKYGLRPGRDSFDMNLIPKNLWRHFIRGLLDADGTIVISTVNESRGKSYIRASTTFGGGENNLIIFAEYFKELGIAPAVPAIRQRHKGRDGHFRTISYCGNVRVLKLLDFLYQDATIYLDRKYIKYLEVRQLNNLK